MNYNSKVDNGGYLNMKKQSLGRGLDSLIPGASSAPTKNIDGLVFKNISITDIEPNPDQPRKSFSTEGLKELSDSIRDKGLLQPIVVMSSVNGKHIIIAGERRYRACLAIGKESMHAIIKKDVSESSQLELALIENIQRSDLTPLEIAAAYANLMDKFSYTQIELAAVVGKNRSSIANTLRLLNLPEEARNALVDGDITAGHARALLALDDESQQVSLVEFIRSEGLSVRGIEDRISMLKRGSVITDILSEASQADRHHTAEVSAEDYATTVEPKVGVGKTSEVAGGNALDEYSILVEKLEATIGCQVKISPRKKGGIIQIKYSNNDDLRSLVEHLVRD